MLIRELGVIPYASIQNGYQMLLDLVERVIADYIEAFEVICEEDLEVVVMGLMQGSIDVVVICTGV